VSILIDTTIDSDFMIDSDINDRPQISSQVYGRPMNENNQNHKRSTNQIQGFRNGRPKIKSNIVTASGTGNW
jgi:hypothetical protein